MKLTKIEILNFGKLSNVTFNLNNNLSLIAGENEAGKSTTVAFIKQILFGFYLKGRHSSFFEDYEPKENKGVMGGELTFKDKKDTFVLRRTYAKGDSKKGVLVVKLNGQSVPENLFFERIQNINGDFYTDSFIFNQDLLRQVTSLNQEELMERIYFLGAAESSKFLQLRDDFKRESESLFKKLGRKPEINQLLRQVEDQQVKLSQVGDEFNQYHNLENELNETTKEKENLQQKVATTQKKKLQFDHLNSQLENYRIYQDLKKKKENITFSSEDLRTAKSIEVQLETLKSNLGQLNRQYSEETNFDNLDKIESLLNKRVEYLQWKNNLIQDEQKITRAKDKIAQLKEYNPDLQKILSLSPQQRKNLKNEYNVFQKKSSNNYGGQEKYLTMFGLALSILGILLALTITPICWLLVLFGGASLGYGYFQKRKRDDQKIEFEQKYNLDPSELALDPLLSNVLEITALEDDITQMEKDRYQIETKLTDYFNQLENITNQKVTKGNIEFVLDELVTRIKALNKDRQVFQEQQRQSVVLKEKINDYEKKLIDLLLANHVTSIKDLEDLAQKAAQQKEIAVKQKTLSNLLKDDLEKLQEISGNLSAFKQEQKEVTQKLAELNTQIDQVQSKLAEIKVKMNELANSDQVFNQRQTLMDLQAQTREKATEYLADLLVSAWISRGLDLASNERFPKMLAHARQYFSLLTGNRYVDIEVGKKIRVKTSTGKKFEVQFLSRGTSEQLYFALKLAFVEQVYDKIALPILIDDAFVNFDGQRTTYIIDLLRKLSETSQVVIFTQKKELVNKLGIKALNFKRKEV